MKCSSKPRVIREFFLESESMTKYFLNCLAASTIFFAGNVQAQEFKANVTVNVDLVPISQRDQITTMQNDVMSYLSTQRFSSKDWEGAKIPIDLTIYITGANPQTRHCTARLFYNMKTNLDGGVASPLMKILDRDWAFSYALNQQFSYQSMKFDEFASAIDFYNFIALGLDADCFEQLSGTKYYQIARDLVQLGATNNGAGYAMSVQEPGEYTRVCLASELLDLRYEEFRKLIFDYHADGINAYLKDNDAGRKGVESVLARMAEFKAKKISTRSYLMQMFFDAKQSEICTLFKGSHNAEVLRYMQVLDPSNMSVYEEAIR